MGMNVHQNSVTREDGVLRVVTSVVISQVIFRRATTVFGITDQRRVSINECQYCKLKYSRPECETK